MKVQTVSKPEQQNPNGEDWKLEQARKRLKENGLLDELVKGQRLGETPVETFQRIAREAVEATIHEEQVLAARQALKKMGITRSALEEANKKGLRGVDLIRQKAIQNAAHQINGAAKAPDLPGDAMFDAIIDEWCVSSDRLAEKDAEIKTLQEKIAALETRIAELEKPAFVS